MSASCSGHGRGLNVFYLGFTPSTPPRSTTRPSAGRWPSASTEERSSTHGSRRAPRCPPHYTPCDIPFGCAGTPWYGFDPALARETLAAAGYPQGFETTIHYPMTARPSLPDPQGVAIDLQTQLQDNLGITASSGRGARRDVCRRRRRREDPGHLPRHADGHLSGCQRVPRPDLRAGRVSSPGQAARRRGQGPRHRTWNGRPRQAGSRVRPGQQRHPRPRPDDPARADRLHGGLPRRRRRSARLAAPAGAVRDDDAGRPPPARVADLERAARPVLRRRDGLRWRC